MRLTIAHKLIAGLAAVSCLGLGAMLVVYWGLATAGRTLRQLSEVREPISRTAHEMEINLKGIGLAVFKYLDSADARSRYRIEDDTADFERFHARYLELAQKDAEKEMGATLGTLFGEFKTLAHALIAKKDEQESAVAVAGENFEKLDDIIDNQLQDDPATHPRLAIVLLDLEADVAEVLAWLATYQRTHDPEHRALMQANEEELGNTLRRLRGLPTAHHQEVWVRELETTLDRTLALVQEIVATDEYLQQEATRFDGLREIIDELLDEQVQPAAYEALFAPREEADRATQRVVRALQVLIPVLVLSALAIALMLVRAITGPLGRLRAGTASISEGNLRHRVEGMAHDELGDLAEDFNRMVTRLEATTVSKERLETSEAELRATVADLRQEISERLRAEAEQIRLQESLRRSETMSAMGSLVAGVAHEVRNPLFGISSTIDALEARLGPREETQRHLGVLRGEVERLNKLMHELLNYGRPVDAPRTPGSISAVLDEAIRACAAEARAAEIAIEPRFTVGDACVAIDRVAMVQVFRNLLENAIQHSPPGGAVSVEAEVACHEGRPFLQCVVSDAGPGFREQDLGRVFDPFFTRRRGGTGLGLSIVRRIVDQHEGHVWAANRPERGAVVTVRLPLADDARAG
jgi:signal transduction histidine kinase